ncbi:hypothetical protein T01_6058 [Trichinella spiralis]|uniref:Uncharacterized protein n=1 Tax=Trichinella spiralis TaxID=6334 RepID=A0A0V1B4C9_TRISP|nr:hypothetical protein T01_6058 [Trichinella spiralis]
MLKYKFARRSFVRQMRVDCIKWVDTGVTFSGVGCDQGLKLVLTAILFGLSDPNPVPPDAMIAILPAVRGYCSCSTRDLWAPAHGWVTPTRSNVEDEISSWCVMFSESLDVDV